jgi:CRP-like cAMP-binding protein
MNEFLRILSPSLKIDVLQHIFISAFKRHDIFMEYEEIIYLFIKDINPNLRAPDDVIISQGENDKFFYFIAEGQVRVTLKDHRCKPATNVKRSLLN